MYLTPILYPLTLVPERCGPGSPPIRSAGSSARLRDALLDGRLALEWGDAVALAVALALFAGGRWVFRRLSPHFEDFLYEPAAARTVDRDVGKDYAKVETRRRPRTARLGPAARARGARTCFARSTA